MIVELLHSTPIRASIKFYKAIPSEHKFIFKTIMSENK